MSIKMKAPANLERLGKTKEAILEFMRQQAQPVSVMDVANALYKSISKGYRACFTPKQVTIYSRNWAWRPMRQLEKVGLIEGAGTVEDKTTQTAARLFKLPGASDAPAGLEQLPPGKTFGERLKALRKERKMSQKTFALALGVSRGALAGVEQGRTTVTSETKFGKALIAAGFAVS